MVDWGAVWVAGSSSGLTAEQKAVLQRIVSIGRQKGATQEEIKAAVETGLVEANLTNPSGGDADSAGWRQERASMYANPTNLNASISRFFDEARAVRGKYSRAGDLAAAVQRPAAQYRGRYQDRSGEAQALLGGSVGGAQSIAGGSGARAAAVAQYLQSSSMDPLDLALMLKGAAGQQAPSLGARSSSYAGRASRIDARHLSYQWGGGHAGKVTPGAAQPLDCSGAVSAVLGINPRVSGDLARWGAPGPGKRVTIYANGKHTFMEIDGHFFGTSASNPGGGAGWIPRSQISPEYLRGFVARHPPGE